ncbi:GNAT family N-acetyltransferase [Salimicrobium flavidum]|uniref:Acetyltransferase (GNAT) domain-containing protein n=1 Tax=Salimicrobium flavidum TaxID=570947 RepID=A0A1N7J271_9BACI|nr:GNAT family N-acetyltransferase [Salimicrobium flavidum]SIS43433.1 Acetyltransferase (GNAT) domain-containing protein [Salimicrobium flavidum]
MNATLKRLTENDKPLFLSMQTGIEDDYIARIFDRLVSSDSHVLYGLFHQGTLVSTAGYSLFAEGTYAMLGRFRSDENHRGKGFVTEILQHIIAELQTNPDIKWIGANTETTNTQAKRVLEKLGMTPYPPLTYTVVPREEFQKHSEQKHDWTEVTSPEEKIRLVKSLHPGRLFAYECYYPFPLSSELLREFFQKQTRLFIDPSGSRYVVFTEDIKGQTYTNVIYPWTDAASSPRLHQVIREVLQDHEHHYGAWFNQQHTDPPLPFQTESRGEWVLYSM